MKDQVMFLLAAIKAQSFVPGYNATDEEAMGMLIAKVFEWDGLAIMRAAAYALEDANFHSEAALVERMAEKAAQ